MKTKYLCISGVPFDGTYLRVVEADSAESAKELAAQKLPEPRVDFVDEVIPLDALGDGWGHYIN